jgi:hypothetical protein
VARTRETRVREAQGERRVAGLGGDREEQLPANVGARVAQRQELGGAQARVPHPQLLVLRRLAHALWRGCAHPHPTEALEVGAEELPKKNKNKNKSRGSEPS